MTTRPPITTRKLAELSVTWLRRSLAGVLLSTVAGCFTSRSDGVEDEEYCWEVTIAVAQRVETCSGSAASGDACADEVAKLPCKGQTEPTGRQQLHDAAIACVSNVSQAACEEVPRTPADVPAFLRGASCGVVFPSLP